MIIGEYAIGNLIEQQIGTEARAWRDLAARLGYKKPDDGVRNLRLAAEKGVVVRKIRERLARALGVEPLICEEVLKHTEQQVAQHEEERLRKLEHEARRTFHPHLVVLHGDPRKFPLVISALIVGDAISPVPLPSGIGQWEIADQLALVRKCIAEHQQRHADNPVLQKLGLLGYAFRCTYDEALYFAPDGSPVPTRPAGSFAGEFWVQLGNRRFDAKVEDEE